MEEIGFISRTSELDQIQTLIGEKGSLSALFIQGEGGIGKTRLLEQVRELNLRGRIKIGSRIDFDDPNLHIIENLQRRLVSELGEEHFRAYNERLIDWHLMEAGGLPASRLGIEIEEANQAFDEGYRKATKSRRVVWLMDTVERLAGSEVEDYLPRLIGQMTNTLVVLSGRSFGDVQQALEERIPEKLTHMSLKALPVEDAQEYLERKQKQRGVRLGKEWVQKILALAEGKPLLLDLATEWLVRKVPLDWLERKTVEQLRSLSEAQHIELERALVSPFASLNTPQDQLFWIMVLVWPLDKEMASRLTGWPEAELNDVWEQVSHQTVVKHMPDDRLMVHDTVRALILKHLRPDMEAERERAWFTKMLDYLQDLRSKLSAELAQLEELERQSLKQEDEQQAWGYIVQKDAVERAIWEIDGQSLSYQLLYDPVRGVEIFDEAFRTATARYRIFQRSALVSQVQRVRDRLALTSDQQFKLDFRMAQYFLDSALYAQAEQLVKRMLETYEDDRRIDLLIQMANIVIRRGRFEEGRSCFEQAAEIARRHGQKSGLLGAENGWGWACRLMGLSEEANIHYVQALELSEELNDQKRRAQVLNNLAYLFTFEGHYTEAAALCEQAGQAWRELDENRGLGALYIVYAELNRRQEFYDKAEEYCRKALDIFQPQNDTDWLSQTYAILGSVKILQGDAAEGEQDLQRAMEQGIVKDRAWILHWLGRAALQIGDVEQAARHYQRGLEVSKKLPDIRYLLYCLWGLANIDLMHGVTANLETYEQEYLNFKRGWNDLSYPTAEGLLLKTMGDLALRRRTPEDRQKAFKWYAQALPMIAQHVSYGPYKLHDQLAQIEQDMQAAGVDARSMSEFGKTMYQQWNASNLRLRYPVGLATFLRWKNLGGVHEPGT
jgi:tetratricopeptide (TPR) repeat protein